MPPLLLLEKSLHWYSQMIAIITSISAYHNKHTKHADARGFPMEILKITCSQIEIEENIFVQFANQFTTITTLNALIY